MIDSRNGQTLCGYSSMFEKKKMEFRSATNGNVQTLSTIICRHKQLTVCRNRTRGKLKALESLTSVDDTDSQLYKWLKSASINYYCMHMVRACCSNVSHYPSALILLIWEREKKKHIHCNGTSPASILARRERNVWLIPNTQKKEMKEWIEPSSKCVCIKFYLGWETRQ